jgi:hypothetical protein
VKMDKQGKRKKKENIWILGNDFDYNSHHSDSIQKIIFYFYLTQQINFFSFTFC